MSFHKRLRNSKRFLFALMIGGVSIGLSVALATPAPPSKVFKSDADQINYFFEASPTDSKAHLDAMLNALHGVITPSEATAQTSPTVIGADASFLIYKNDSGASDAADFFTLGTP